MNTRRLMVALLVAAAGLVLTLSLAGCDESKAETADYNAPAQGGEMKSSCPLSGGCAKKEASCEKKSCGKDCDKPCCDEADAKACPKDSDKPCCAEGEKKACPASCTTSCCQSASVMDTGAATPCCSVSAVTYN